METSCRFSCLASYKCSCDLLLCDHMLTEHAKQGHTIGPLPKKVKLNQILSEIPKKKQEIIRLDELLISEIKKKVSKELAKLEELGQIEISLQSTTKSAINTLKEKVAEIEPNELFNKLINKLGFKNQLQELQDQTEQAIESYKSQKKTLKTRINTLNNELKKQQQEKNQLNEAITTLNQSVKTSNENIQKVTEISASQKRNLEQKIKTLNNGKPRNNTDGKVSRPRKNHF